MKKVLILSLFCVILSGLMSAQELPFIEEYFYPRTIIIAFTRDAVGNRFGEIEVSYREDGIVITPLEGFNRLAEEFGVTDIVRKFEYIKYLDWHDKGVYLQNIFRVFLQSNENIEEVQAALAGEADILFAEYESINRPMSAYIPNDPQYYLQWHHPAMELPYAWNYVQGSSEIIVAISDVGVKWNHEDLADNIWINEAELPLITIDWANGEIYGGDGIDNDGNGMIDDVIGWDFYDSNNNPFQLYEGNQRGTHVAGCVGAVGDNNIGVTGTAMNVSLLICKGGPSNAPANVIVDGYGQMIYAAHSGAHIINCSWGGVGTGAYPNSVINYVIAHNSLVIAAAGSSNMEHSAYYQIYPADADNSFSVAATNQDDIKAVFSDYGLPIDISAPGVSIRSTVYQYTTDQYQSTQGTSYSAPLVSGIAALVKSLHPELSPLDLKYRIMSTADCIDELNPNYQGLLGSGRVNAFRATMFDLIPRISYVDYALTEYAGDGDGVPNPGEEISLVLGLYNSDGWSDAIDLTATLSTERPDVDVTSFIVSYPFIEAGSLSYNEDQPFRFITCSFTNDLEIPFILEISTNEGTPYPYLTSFEFTVTLSLQQAGWPIDLTGSSSSSAALIDLDGSGTKEIIFGDSQGNLNVIKYDGTPYQGFPVSLGSAVNSAAAVADLNNNGSAEIIVNSQNGVITAVDNEGNILFQYDTEGELITNPLLADVNNNGFAEIIALTSVNPRLIILNHDGTDYEGFPVTISGGVTTPSAAADLNNDGYREIIFTTANGSLHAVSVLTGDDISGMPITLDSASHGGVFAGDVSGNNQPDIALATWQGTVYAFEGNGNLLFSRDLGNQIKAGLLVKDLNSNGQSEIIVPDMAGNIHVLDNAGNDLNAFPFNTGSSIEHVPVLADMNIDGNLDIIYGDNAGYLHSISIWGAQTDGFPLFLENGFSAAPAIGYVNENPFPDILIPGNDLYSFIDYKHPIGSIGWGYFRGNIARTGNAFDMTPIEQLPENEILKTELRGNHPNPFNPDTRISFIIAQEGYVSLKVYNIRGQQVRKLRGEIMTKGEQSVLWDGTDDRGRNMSSGLYFYKLRTEDYQGVGKMMLIK